MATNVRTAGMKAWAKRWWGTYFHPRKRLTNLQQAIRRQRVLGGVSRATNGLFPKARRSWKGPTGFRPRCRKGHPVDFDMARCFKCDPLPKLSRNKTLVIPESHPVLPPRV